MPLGRPCVGCDKGTDISKELWSRRPVPSVEKRIDLDVRAVDQFSDPLSESGLAGSGDARDEDSPRQMREGVAMGEHLLSLGFASYELLLSDQALPGRSHSERHSSHGSEVNKEHDKARTR